MRVITIFTHIQPVTVNIKNGVLENIKFSAVHFSYVGIQLYDFETFYRGETVTDSVSTGGSGIWSVKKRNSTSRVFVNVDIGMSC